MKKKEDVLGVSVSDSQVDDTRSSIYEVGYIMVPSIPEEGLSEEVMNFKNSLEAQGAVFISDEYPKMIELAHQMSRSIANKKHKFSYGYFGWVKFECSTEQAKIIKNNLDLNEKLVRYLLIKTVRESTMSSKRPYGKTDLSRRKVKSEESLPIDEAVIDKEIDALVA